MTPLEAYEIALSYDNTTRDQDDSLKVHAVNWTNTFLHSVFLNENAIRKFHNETEFTFIPVLEDMEDVIPYHDELIREALPMYIASQIAFSDGNNVIMSRYYDAYINAVNCATPYIEQKTRDVWGCS